MKNVFNERTLKVIRIIRIIATIVCACEIIRRFATGESTRHLIFIVMLLMAPFKIYDNHVVTRKQFESTGRGEEYKKIVIKSIIQGILIVTVFVVCVVIYAVYFR